MWPIQGCVSRVLCFVSRVSCSVFRVSCWALRVLMGGSASCWFGAGRPEVAGETPEPLRSPGGQARRLAHSKGRRPAQRSQREWEGLGNQICSGRGGGAGSQVVARSTTWRMRLNQKAAVWGGRWPRARGGREAGFWMLSSSCELVFIFIFMREILRSPLCHPASHG